MSKRNNGGNSIFVKVMAGILALLMVGSMCFTLIYYLIQTTKA